MKPETLAKKYMSCFFGEEPVENMRGILSDDLEFCGPFCEFYSANAYLESLKESPPEGMTYDILKEYSDRNSCCLIYLFKKKGIETTMSQIFEVRENRISKILLIFDASKFSDVPDGHEG